MTYSMFLVSALAVAGLGLFLRRRSESWSRLMMMVGAVGCAACVAWQVRQTMFTPAAKGPDRGQAAVAYYLAQQVLGEVGKRQGRLVLLFPPESVLDEETVGTYVGTFSRVLRGFPALNVQVVRLAVGGKAAKTGNIPLAAFQQAMSNAPAAAAYVSFAGVPADIATMLATAPPPAPACFVFDPWGTTNWLTALKQGQVRTVIVPRPGVDPRAGEGIAGSPNEVFDRLYLMGTPATADQTAAQLEVK